MLGTLKKPVARLGDFIDAFENAQARSRHANLADFLPAADDPIYGSVLRELVRVDLEYRWERGTPRRLDDYVRDFPRLAESSEALKAIAFEEFRLRDQAGEQPRLEEYRERYGISVPNERSRAEVGTMRVLTPAAPAEPPATLPSDLEAAARAYQEFLDQKAAGRSASVEDWCKSYPGSANHAGLFRDVHADDPEAARRLARSVTTMPQVGEAFLGFELVGELGRGAFGRVFLARQGDLAHRPVALKVSNDLNGESQTLAQLQHTNIVPIYSMHRAEPFQAVCMPYFGGTTLADVCKDLSTMASVPDSGRALVSTLNLRQRRTVVEADMEPPAEVVSVKPGGAPQAILDQFEGQTYVEAVLWIGARLADGLTHAHERGILHHDLKPANVLLTDEGQPMLLDFNLSEDTKLHGGAAVASVGGTLLYMAPEHLVAFRDREAHSDPRSDLYSLGLILFELLTRQHPCPVPRGQLCDIIPQMITQRQGPPPDARQLNPAISPAVASILRHCLEPVPDQRYRNARELRDDLDRHLSHLPLRWAPEPSLRERAGKWMRRHPRLTSSTTVGAAATVLLLVLGGVFGTWALRSAQRDEAQQTREQFKDELRTAQFLLNTQNNDPAKRAKGIRAGREGLALYDVLDKPAWKQAPRVRQLPAADQQILREDIGELLLLLARASIWEAADMPPGLDRDEVFQAARQLNERAEACYADDGSPPTLWLQRADLEHRLGRTAEAGRASTRAAAQPASTPRDKYLLGAEHAAAGRYRQALPLLRDASRENPRSFWATFIQGICHDRLGHDGEAVACYSSCIALWPNYAWSYFNRGAVRLRQRDAEQARADFSRALRLQPDLVEAQVNRALAWHSLGKHAEAIADLTAALDNGASETRLYFLRARIRERAGDSAAAKRDRDEGLRRQPSDELSWIARGLAHVEKDPKAALANFEQALRVNPRSFGALQNIANVLGDEPGKLREAIDALTKALAFAPDFVPARSGRAVLLAREGKRQAAHADAEEALLRDPSPATVYQVAGVYALTSKQQPGDRLKALSLLANALRNGFGHDLIDSDPDLDPIREQSEFRRLVSAAQAIRGSAILPK